MPESWIVVYAKGDRLMNTARLQNRLKGRHQEGFAIIEALIAMVVFAIGMLAVLSMQTTAVRTNDTARGVSEQSVLAAEQLERLIGMPYADPNLTDGNHAAPDQGRYTITWTVTDDGMINNTKTIAVTVAWNEHGLTKSINLTYIKTSSS
jgi:type IV pilus assembly protein PilV